MSPKVNNCSEGLFMYRRPKFLEVLLAIRREMARDADYDVDLFAELARSGEWRKAEPRAKKEGQAEDANPTDTEALEMRA
jgi:hypothetical protein